jgi:hypothetical protein
MWVLRWEQQDEHDGGSIFMTLIVGKTEIGAALHLLSRKEARNKKVWLNPWPHGRRRSVPQHRGPAQDIGSPGVG